MAVKKYKPVTPSLRGMTGHTFEEITKTKPERSLIIPKRRTSGRNMYGRITVRHRGGGHRRHIRQVDFKRNKHGDHITEFTGLLKVHHRVRHKLLNHFFSNWRPPSSRRDMNCRLRRKFCVQVIIIFGVHPNFEMR